MSKLKFEKCVHSLYLNGVALNRYSQGNKVVLLVQDVNYHNIQGFFKKEFCSLEEYSEWFDSFESDPYNDASSLNEKLESLRWNN